ncbi:MAG: sulfatase-like hydrolase/transferase, partial [Planctomycetota bacterium]|nr:sulfatase-like hydrolase/transferase [Planctomycetota bacterium]
MNWAGLLLLGASLLLALAAPTSAMAQKAGESATAKQPNFIFIQGEGQGWSSTSVQMGGGESQARPEGLTPNLEKLAAAGVRMSDFYATCPRCTPARASFLTGISPAKLQMTYVNEGGTGKREAEQGRQPLIMRMTTPSPTMELPEGVKTTGDVLREIGYATAHFGKWHVGRTDPTRHGFDVSDGANTNQGPERGVAPNPMQSVA